MSDAAPQDEIIDHKNSKILAELPNDREHRILLWVGHIVQDVEKNEPKLQLIFTKFDPSVRIEDELLGSNSFYRKFNPGEVDKNKFYQNYLVGIELIVLLKLGSIWRGQQEVGRILTTKFKKNTISFNIPAALVSNPDNIFSFKEVFGSNENYYNIPDDLKSTTYLFQIIYPIINEFGNEDEVRLILPVTEAFRKFYCLSSHCVYGTVTGVFTDVENAPFEKSDRGIETEGGIRTAHINYLSPLLTEAEAAFVGMLLYSKPALEGARLITDTLASSIKNGPGIISSTKFPYDEGLISLEARYKRVLLSNNTWAFLVLEIIRCSGQKPFDLVNPHSPLWTKSSEEKNPNSFPPNIKFKNLMEAGFTGIDSSLTRDPKMKRVHVTVDEDLTSGYGGITILKTKELPRDYKSEKLEIYLSGDLKKLATGFGDIKSHSGVPGTNITGKGADSNNKNNERRLGELIEVFSLEFFKRSLQSIINLKDPDLKKSTEDAIFTDKFVKLIGDERKKSLIENTIKVDFIVFKGLECAIPKENKVDTDKRFWSEVVGEENHVYPRRAVIVKISFKGSDFVFFEFEKFKSEQIRTIVLAQPDFLTFRDNDAIRMIFQQLCKNRAVYKKIKENKFFHQFKMKVLNHRYELKEIHLTRRILETISDRSSFNIHENQEAKFEISSTLDA